MATNKLVVLQLALAVFCPNEEKDLGSIGQHDVLKRENGENVGLLWCGNFRLFSVRSESLSNVIPKMALKLFIDDERTWKADPSGRAV